MTNIASTPTNKQCQCCRTASPGKLGSFEEELYHNTDMADVPVVMAVFLQYVEGSRSVGVAYCDATGRKLGACQFTDDEHFCNLETVLVQLGAKECVLPKVRASCCNFSMCCLKIPPSAAQAEHTVAEEAMCKQQVQACWL